MTLEDREATTIRRDPDNETAPEEIHQERTVRDLSPAELVEQEMSEVPERNTKSSNNANVGAEPRPPTERPIQR